jgi:hypothetical protein
MVLSVGIRKYHLLNNLDTSFATLKAAWVLGLCHPVARYLLFLVFAKSKAHKNKRREVEAGANPYIPTPLYINININIDI